MIRRFALVKGLRGGVVFEVGAAILFFGVFGQQISLQQAGTAALAELATRGYQVPNENDPVRVFPALTSADFSGRHAGGWRPGTIYLRRQPQGGFDASVYLRHELFHEVSHRSCGGRLPVWAEEAGAMQFSGELSALEPGEPIGETTLQGLRERIQQGSAMEASERTLLGRLVAENGWPVEPCTVSPALQARLGGEGGGPGASAYLLMSLQSGRILDRGGDQQSRQPPGSLLKLAYAATLEQANPEVLSAELATSDSDKLLQRRQQFQPERYRRLLSVIANQRLTANSDDCQQRLLPSRDGDAVSDGMDCVSQPHLGPLPEGEGMKPEISRLSAQDWLVYLGGRDNRGNFPVQASLPELALVMRAALLAKPDYFRGLNRNGSLPGSTLAGQAPADLALLRQMQVLAKTGTVSTEQGQPIVGHLLLAWPAPHPQFLAVFRQTGNHGAGLLPQAAAWLRAWQKDFPPRFASTRVRLLSATSPESWQAEPDCPELANGDYRFSVCGSYRIVSTARGSRSERRVEGLLHQTGGGPVVLETDSLSYADAVLAAEAQTLTGSARQAMRAVVVWNASHGSHRHGDSTSLCDTTHCMVFLGDPVTGTIRRNGVVDSALLTLLDTLTAEQGLNWLPFSTGGDERWQRELNVAELNRYFNEAQIWDIRRERRKDNALYIRLIYPDSEEAVSCEIFRNTLKLPSCPDVVVALDGQKAWRFQGLGVGHGMGLSIVRAQALGANGQSAEQILRDAYAKPQ